MSTYKTKNPLGSAAVKDLYDNAENVDKFVNDRTKEELEDRLGVLRKTWHGMEMIFSRFIDYITGRGEQAVAAIGWQELGNWAVGLAVDNRQQIVYYNGSWYKYLGELEHVIAGDSPENDGGLWSAANPTGKWSNIGDAALRSNLGSGEGLSLLGSVSPRSGLRNVKTSYSGQSVLMKQAVIGGPVLNAIATHKPGLAVADDDYSTFITADGQVYQFDISAGVDFRLAGALLDGSNAGESIKKIVDTEVAKAITAGSIDACKKVVLIRPVGNSDLTQLILDTNETFIVPSFMSLWHVGQVRYKFNGLTKPAFRICNEIPGLTSSMVDFVDRQGAEVIKGNGYLVEIIGPNPATYDEWYALTQSNPSAVSSAAGIEFGNTYSSKTLLDCRDTIIENVAIERFHGGLRLHGFDTYINIFRNLKITSCVYTFYEPDAGLC